MEKLEENYETVYNSREQVQSALNSSLALGENDYTPQEAKEICQAAETLVTAIKKVKDRLFSLGPRPTV